MLSGVLQGCPLSGTVFAVSFDSPLRCLVEGIGDRGLVLACADDVLLLLRAISAVQCVVRIFAIITLATGMIVNLSKCVAVPLWREFCPAAET